MHARIPADLSLISVVETARWHRGKKIASLFLVSDAAD